VIDKGGDTTKFTLFPLNVVDCNSENNALVVGIAKEKESYELLENVFGTLIATLKSGPLDTPLQLPPLSTQQQQNNQQQRKRKGRRINNKKWKRTRQRTKPNVVMMEEESKVKTLSPDCKHCGFPPAHITYKTKCDGGVVTHTHIFHCGDMEHLNELHGLNGCTALYFCVKCLCTSRELVPGVPHYINGPITQEQTATYNKVTTQITINLVGGERIQQNMQTQNENRAHIQGTDRERMYSTSPRVRDRKKQNSNSSLVV
jgi:hypothetical protein